MIGRLLLASGGVVTGIYLGSKHCDKVEFAKQKLLSVTRNAMAQWTEGSENDIVEKSNPHLTSAKQLMRKAVGVTRDSGKFAILSTTSSEDGHVASRLIQPFPVEFDPVSGLPVVYFNTNKLSRKFDDMNKCPDVALTYMNEKNMSYVTYRGQVRRIAYPQSTQHWHDGLYMFYPEGNNEEKGSRFTTWVLVPRSIQMVSVADGLVSERDDWRPPEVCLDSASTNWILTCNGQNSTE